MTEAECRQALKEAQIGRIACALDKQPYIVPMYFAYSEHYPQSRSNQKRLRREITGKEHVVGKTLSRQGHGQTMGRKLQ